MRGTPGRAAQADPALHAAEPRDEILVAGLAAS